MKFAVVEGEKQEAQPGLAGECQACGSAAIAKCGKHRIWHWAHKGVRSCDPWWESETEWHRDWKGEFPKEWQEIIQAAENGEKHIADVKTGGGTVLEFQHSFLSEAERLSRELFYPKLVWVVDGRRRARDRAQFFASFGSILSRQPLIVSARASDSALLRDWKASRVPVYFDFGESDPSDPVRFEAPSLWRLNPNASTAGAYLSPVAKSYFIEVKLNGLAFDDPFTETIGMLADLQRKRQSRAYSPPSQFDRYLARKQRARRRL